MPKLGSLAVSDKLVERLRCLECNQEQDSLYMNLAADRIEELEAQVKWLTGEKSAIAGWPWESPYMDGYEVAKEEYRDRIEELERALREARDALEQIEGNAWRPWRRDPDSFCHPEGCHSPGIARTALAKLSAAPERQKGA
jgi:hypothetical protein